MLRETTNAVYCNPQAKIPSTYQPYEFLILHLHFSLFTVILSEAKEHYSLFFILTTTIVVIPLFTKTIPFRLYNRQIQLLTLTLHLLYVSFVMLPYIPLRLAFFARLAPALALILTIALEEARL